MFRRALPLLPGTLIERLAFLTQPRKNVTSEDPAASVSCVNVSQDSGSFKHQRIKPGGTPRSYITPLCNNTRRSAESRPHLLENEIYRLPARRLRILPPRSIPGINWRDTSYCCSRGKQCSQCSAAYVKVR